MPEPPPQQPPSLPPAQGYGYPPGYYPQYPMARPSNGLAVASMVCGIVAVVICWIPFVNFVSIALAIVALILGIVGHNRAGALLESGRGMAVAGIVCGAIAIVVSLLFDVWIGVAVHSVVISPHFHLPTPFPT